MSLSDDIDLAANATKFIGGLATAAVTVGGPALTIVELLAPWIPGLGPILTDVQIALPILKQIATYAPQVQAALVNGKPLIEAVVGIGGALLSPLDSLATAFPQVTIAGVAVVDILKASEFTPQDTRFDRAQGKA